MTTVQLHTTHALSMSGVILHTLQMAVQACAAQAARPINDAWVQALVLEVTFQPLAAQADGTLVENLLDVRVDHRAWQVAQDAAPRLFGQLLTGLRVTGQAVTWSYRPSGQGRVAVQAWANVGT